MLVCVDVGLARTTGVVYLISGIAAPACAIVADVTMSGVSMVAGVAVIVTFVPIIVADAAVDLAGCACHCR